MIKIYLKLIKFW